MTPDCLSFPLLKPILLQQACPGLPYLFVDCRHLVVCSQVNIVAFQKKSCKLWCWWPTLNNYYMPFAMLALLLCFFNFNMAFWAKTTMSKLKMFMIDARE
jgi:hypothetical protein